jgi:Ras-related protein Rab-5C
MSCCAARPAQRHGRAKVARRPRAKTDRTSVVLVGESSSGKTSLIHRFVANDFRLQYDTNMGAVLSERTVFTGDTEAVQLDLWDTPGVRSMRHMAPMYYRAAAVAIVVFDVTSTQSFDDMKGWVDELKSLGPADIRILIAANKCDRPDQREIDYAEAMAYATEAGAQLFETSAKDGSGVEHAPLPGAHCTCRVSRVSLLASSEGPARANGAGGYSARV